MSRILVTGANGFIGYPLCVELSRRGHHVRGAVRSTNPLPDHLEQVTVGTIDGETDWTEALSGIEIVIHLAGPMSAIKRGHTDPMIEYLRVNLQGTVNLAKQSAQAGVRRLVYLSSVKVNGGNTDGIKSFTEADLPHPDDPYAISKYRAEQALQEISNQSGLEIVIIRAPLVYGPGVKRNFLELLAAVDKGVPLPLAGAVKPRSLVYVGNLVDAMITCATDSAAAGQVYLVSDGEDVSTSTLLEKIAQALGSKARTFYFPPSLIKGVAKLIGRAEQVDRLFGALSLSNAKIRTELGWIPPYSLEQGLNATAQWFRKRTSGYNHNN